MDNSSETRKECVFREKGQCFLVKVSNIVRNVVKERNQHEIYYLETYVLKKNARRLFLKK